MSWLSLSEIRERLAELQDLGRQRALTSAELDEYERLDFNRAQRVRRLTEQHERARAKIQRIERDMQEHAA